MRVRWLATLAAMAVLAPMLAAQTPPGRWEKLDGQVVGTRLKITLMTGSVLEGTFQRSGSEDISVTTETGDLTIPKSDVQKIITRSRKDSLKNGMLIGLLAGAGSAA